MIRPNLFCMLLVVFSVYSYGDEKTQRPTKLEFRLVEQDRHATTYNMIPTDKQGYRVQADKGGQQWLVSPDILLANQDILSAKVMSTKPDGAGVSFLVIELTFTADGAKNLLRVSQDNLGKTIGTFVEGALVEAVYMQSVQSAGRLQILGGAYPRDGMELIATGIVAAP